MSTQPLEAIPSTWNDEHDVPFFRLVTELFPRHILDGATVLLASYDPEPELRSYTNSRTTTTTPVFATTSN